MKLFFSVITMVILSNTHMFSQTQMELTRQSAEATKKAEKKLDTIYFSILKLYSKDTLFIKNLKASQNSWKKYYLNQVNSMFPDYPDETRHYGSMKSMCVTGYARNIVELRIRELEKWLIGYEDGDCDSSIKRKENLPKYNPYITIEE